MTHEDPRETVARYIEAARARTKRLLVAIDGQCAAGKTSTGAYLRKRLGCEIVHMDDFFLRPEQRTPDRLREPGGNVDYERFLREALAPLSRGEGCAFQPFDCHTRAFAPAVFVKPAPITVVEGSYACHPALRGYYDLRVFLSVAPDEQLRRIALRDGDVAAFRDKWIPLEELYFAACGVRACCDLVL